MNKKFFHPDNESFNLPEKEVHIWIIDLDKVTFSIETAKGLLSKEELVRSGNFHFKKDEIRFIYSRVFLRLLLNFYMGISVREIDFSFNNFGKPEISTKAKNQKINFNLSHSKNMLCLAIANNNSVGVDCEIIKHIDDYITIAEKHFSEIEVQQLKSFSREQQLEAFYICWTSKEAVIKLIGTGLHFPLQDFSVKMEYILNNQTYNYKPEFNNYKNDVYVEVFRVDKNLLGACAVKSSSIKTTYYFFEVDNYSVDNFLKDHIK